MKISYLPEMISPTGSTVFPVSQVGITKKATLSQLEVFSGPGSIGEVIAGTNIELTPVPAFTVATISFSFPGAIFPFPGNSLPSGWLFCLGQEISRVVYKDLFSVLGTTYGSGNGVTFNLPDLRGRLVVGQETMGGVSSSNRLQNSLAGNIPATSLGAIGGTETETLNSQEVGLKSHTHTHSVSVSWGGGNQGGNTGNGGDSETSGTFAGAGGPYPVAWGFSFTNNPVSDSSAIPHTNLPPLAFLNWCIKY